MRGRKATPTAMHLVRGNPGKHKSIASLKEQLENEPKPAFESPNCPEELLNEWEKQGWDYLVSQLTAMGTIASSDRGEMVCYACAWGQWAEAQIQLKKYTKVGITEGGNPKKNPWVILRNEAMRDLSRYGANLLLNPTARVGKTTNNGQKKESKLAKFQRIK